MSGAKDAPADRAPGSALPCGVRDRAAGFHIDVMQIAELDAELIGLNDGAATEMKLENSTALFSAIMDVVPDKRAKAIYVNASRPHHRFQRFGEVRR
jgi:hypothetical protein